LHGRDLLFQGAQWGIGDGKTVKILSDNWIPHCPPGMLKPTSAIPAFSTVHCLLDEERGDWCPETVHAFFDTGMAERIMQIPIARRVGEDFVR
jgi:hypothetical protein